MGEEYVDLELYVAGESQALLRFGDRDCAGRPDLSEATRTSLLALDGDAKKSGELLFNRLFQPNDGLLTCYRECLYEARRNRKRVRLRIHLDVNAAADLHDLPWERLYDPVEDLALGRSREVVLSRYLAVSKPRQAQTVLDPKLLMVLSCPNDLARYGLPTIEREPLERALTTVFDHLSPAISFEILPPPATRERIFDRVLSGGFHALHLQAHGVVSERRDRASIVLEKDDGTADIVDEAGFAELFEGDRELRLITLIACHGAAVTQGDPFKGLGRRLVEQGAPAVVAMTHTIEVETAQLFSRHFYRHLARSGEVDAAVNVARWQLFNAVPDALDWCAPVVFMRLADATLWTSPGRIEVAPDGLQEIWPNLLLNLKQGRLVPILGPELNRGLLPSGQEIARDWGSSYHIEKYSVILERRNDLPRVAKFVETKVGLNYPHTQLMELYKNSVVQRAGVAQVPSQAKETLTQLVESLPGQFATPDDAWSILASLRQVSLFVTTTFDPFLTLALKRSRLSGTVRDAQRISCRWREHDDKDNQYTRLSGSAERPLVFHVYGDDRAPDSLVLTEDDYLRFLRLVTKDEWRIPSQLRKALTDSMLLFLGFNTYDLDFRVLFESMVIPLKDRSKDRVAVLLLESHGSQYDEIRQLQQFLKADCDRLHLKVQFGSVADFLAEMKQRDGL